MATAKRKAVAAAKADAALRAAPDRQESITFTKGSQVGRLGRQRLTNAHGEETERGAQYRGIARERGTDDSLNPWVRGTVVRGRPEYATRRSGKEQAVARWQNGNLLPTRGAGEQYFGAHREEYVIEVPTTRVDYVPGGARNR